MKKTSLMIIFACVACIWGGQVLLAEEMAEDQSDAFVYDDQGLRDPLMPLVTSSGEIIKLNSELSSSDLALEGIMYAPNGNGIAMINGKLLNQGDTIGPFKVTEVRQFSVILYKGSEQIQLKLKKGD